MILLRALQSIPNSIAMIEKGQTFYEPDPEREAQWIAQAYAEPVVKINAVTPPKLNSRGWDGLNWDGATVCILASGPSLALEQVARVQQWAGYAQRKVIAINTTFRLAPWADMLYACDLRWWELYHAEARAACSGEFWTLDVAAAKKYYLHLIQSERKAGIGKRPGIIHQGSASGYQAINLAWMAGATKIVLLGFDAQVVNKQVHWHGDHPSGIRANNPYQLWIQNFETLAADLAENGCEVLNATPGSALRGFKKVPLEEALA